MLAIEAVTSEDAGTYKCLVSNTGGEASAELRLTITVPLQVDIVPNIMSVHMGASAEFRCSVTSNGMSIGLQHITWYKDGRQLPSSSRSGDTLLITDVSREDKGMYQCVVRRQDGDSFQATAELQLGGELYLNFFVFKFSSYSIWESVLAFNGGIIQDDSFPLRWFSHNYLIYCESFQFV